MLDNQLIQVFLPIITANLASMGYPEVIVKQAYQPTQQGAVSGPVVYFSKIGDSRFGWVERKEVWDSIAQQMRHTETQFYETTFQFNGFVVSSPQSISYTASDLTNIVAQILQLDSTLDTFSQQDVGVLRIQDVRNVWYVDDRDRFEASPSFDVVFNHKQVYQSVSNVIEFTELVTYPV